MAINDPNYRYATHTWEANGVRIDYEIAFDGGYIRQSDVVAFSVLVDPDTGLISDRQVHTLTFQSEAVDPDTEWKTATVRISPAIPSGRRVVIFRSTEKSASLVNYQDGSVITEANLDLANKQAILAIAEIMDGLNAASIRLDTQVQEVIDQSILINLVYQQVLDLLNAGGIVSVAPRVWAGVGDGTTTDFPLEGADVDGAGFYDTYLNGVGLRPNTAYSIIMGATFEDTLIRFTVAPGNGVAWFTVLRGYAKPYTGPTPITTRNIPVVRSGLTSYFAGGESKYSLIVFSNPAAVTVTVKNTELVGDVRIETGCFFSATQQNTGQVTLVEDTNVDFIVPAGFLPKTRAQGCTVSATCIDADDNLWLISGELAEA